MSDSQVTMDGNEAAAYVAYKTNEVIAIYPITPATPMGELSDAWAAAGQRNLWGGIPVVQEMQSEGGAAGAVHGSLQTGSLTTTFTASQGLLLMIPNMYKIAGELTSTVFHITARTLATHALSIFGDHSDVMATRQTGWGMLFGNSVQEVTDFALISQAATLRARVPFLNIFDGFRTSHEILKITRLEDEDIAALIDDNLIREHRARALNPEHPVMRGAAENPDVFFQAREANNPYYVAAPGIVQDMMDKLAERTGRAYHLFDYEGAPDAERVIIIMGSGAETVGETVEHLNAAGAKLGVLKVRLFRPFAADAFLSALPASVKKIAVLDRTKEPGSVGEPLYQDIVTSLCEGWGAGHLPNMPQVIGGRYGLSSKEFTPSMVKAIYDELEKPQPLNHFTIGINDDVTHTSLSYDESFNIEHKDGVRALFYGLGSDGTVGANKNSIKIIGEDTPNNAQGYFVYDSKKSGSVTASHLRFGPAAIRKPYLLQSANFIAVHVFSLLDKMPSLDIAEEGATFLLNAPYPQDEVWSHLPRTVQNQIIEKKLHFYVIDGYEVAKAAGLGGRINTIMQTCFFALSNVLPRDEAIEKIKQAIKKTYGKRGDAVVQQNFAVVDAALAHLHMVTPPAAATSVIDMHAAVPDNAPDFVKKFTAEIIAGRGDALPVSAMSADGTFPTATSQWEKRAIATEVPVWDQDVCIQCGKCIMVCPHAVIRSRIADSTELANAPAGFKSAPAKWRELADKKYTLQISVDDCTGCTLCVEVCPAKNKSNTSRKAINMEAVEPVRDAALKDWEFFQNLEERPAANSVLRFNNIKNVQLLPPLFEFSGACAGCGETPYVKLVSQLFGERAVIANATGCSSIYGGNLPTTPWSQLKDGRGPAWSNSLFEDNAEFGLGMRLSLDSQRSYARRLVKQLASTLGDDLATAVLEADQEADGGIAAQRERVIAMKQILSHVESSDALNLMSVIDSLVKKSVWIIGGDGWAYDIGYGGLDHVLSTGHNVNVLVLDTEVYSNTGGQASKSTARGAVAKFAAGGKPGPKKDLGQMIASYGNVYVASVSLGANDAQTVKAFLEAEAFDGPSLIIAYSHCIAHGIDMSKGMTQQKMAVESGYWPLWRFDPRLTGQGKNPFVLDSKAPSLPLKDYIYTENRYRMLQRTHPEAAAKLLQEAQEDVRLRYDAFALRAAAAPVE